MDETKWNELEIAPRSTVMQAAKQFAGILGETPQFQELLQSNFNFRNDAEAQKARQEFQKKHASLKALIALKAVSEEDQQELQRLQDQFNQAPSFVRHIKAQDELVAICQETGDILSKAIGLDYGASCKTGGCCG
jgi:cell fate (sporulation/competence/biofilm development) regulator YlbF (YheA/YmcA/DUF963 family)